MIRVGIVGAGGNTLLRHIPGLRCIEGVEIVSVCNRTPTSSERVAAQFGFPKVYERWEELVAAPDTDAIVIGTWPYFHHRVTLAALGANKHVLCEARMAMDAVQAHEMLAASRARPHLVAQIVPSPFTFRVDRTVQRLLSESYLGQVLALRARDGNAFVDSAARLVWRQDSDLSGFNVLTLGIWYEALMRWVGPATRVMAMVKTFTRMRRDAGGVLRAVRVPEHVDVTAEMACGAQAQFEMSAVTGLAGAAEAWLFGSEGTLRFVSDKLYGGRRGETALAEIPVAAEDAGHWRVEQEFVNAIRGLEPVRLTTFEDGVKYMEFTEAVARSAATGNTVALPLALNG